MRRILFLFFLCGFLMSSGGARAADAMNAVAERYAHLVLALGQHDPDYVDAFYGPPEWKTQAEKEKKSLDAIGAEAADTAAKILSQRRSFNRRIANFPQRVRVRMKAKIPTEESRIYDADAQIAARIFAETNFRAGGAGADVEGRKIKVRRRVARALRRRCADLPPFTGFALRPDHCPTGGKDSRQGSVVAALRGIGGSRL